MSGRSKGGGGSRGRKACGAEPEEKKRRRRTLLPANGPNDLDEVDDEEEQFAALRAREGSAERLTGSQAAEAAALDPAQIVAFHRENLAMVEKNKVTAKNAFSLNFDASIRHIQEAAGRSDAFEEFGKGVEASAKIFSYRVDNVYQSANRVVGSLRGGDGNQGANDDEEDNDGQARRKEKKRRRPAGVTIEETVEKLNVEGVRTDTGQLLETAKTVTHEDDALFRQVVSKYDEGGSLGLLLNNVYPEADAAPNPRLHCLGEPGPSTTAAEAEETDEVGEGALDFCLGPAEDAKGPPCVTGLKPFRFTGWDPKVEARRRAAEEGDQLKAARTASQQLLNNSQSGASVDNDAVEAALIAETTRHQGERSGEDVGDLALEDDDLEGFGDDIMDDDEDGEEGQSRPDSRGSARSKTSARPESRLTSATVSLISGNQTDYSNFDPDRLAAFQRPGHWRKAQPRDAAADPAAARARRLEKRDKAAKATDHDDGLVKFTDVDKFKQKLEEAQGSKESEDVTMTERAWELRVARRPDQLSDPRLAYDSEAFATFCLRPAQRYATFLEEMDKLAARIRLEEDDDEADALDFENQHQEGEEESTVMPMFGESVMEDQTMMGPASSAATFQPALATLAEEEEDGHEAETSQLMESTSQRSAAGASPSYTAGETSALVSNDVLPANSQNELAEDGLVTGAAAINVPHVAFSKKICRVNVGRFRKHMWETLKTEAAKDPSAAEEDHSPPEHDNPSADPRLGEGSSEQGERLRGQTTFRGMLGKIPKRAIHPEKAVHPSTSLTVFLHMCNQKGLRLSRMDGARLETPEDVRRHGWGDFANFRIAQVPDPPQ